MIKTSYACNSLKLKDLFPFFLAGIFTSDKTHFYQLFIKKIAEFFSTGIDNIFLFGSARMGLFTLIKIIHHDENSEVIVAGYTCVVVTNAIKHAGYKAIYADIEEDSLNISTTAIEESITDQTKAIIVTHNFGIVYEDIGYLKKKYPGIVIIEDGAHTFGSLDRSGNKAGVLGDAAFFSLEYNKPLTTAMGGILIINNKNLLPGFLDACNTIGHYPCLINLKLVSTLTAHLITSYKYSVFLKGVFIRLISIFGMMYSSSSSELMGNIPKHYPVRLSNHLAFLGYLQIRKIDEINRVKSLIVKNYYETFVGTSGIKLFYSSSYNYVRFPILFDISVSYKILEQIKRELLIEGIYLGEWFNDVVHPKGSYRYCYSDGQCRIGESIADRIINLPVNVHCRLNQNELNFIKRVIVKNLTAIN